MNGQCGTYVVGLALWPFGPEIAAAVRELPGVAVLSPDDREGGTVMVVCDATSAEGATESVVRGARHKLTSRGLDVEVVGACVASCGEMTTAVAEAFPDTADEPLELEEAILCYLTACQPSFTAV